ncbi:MAG: type III-A CRISPR-associated RAMP protein Csm4 [Candidatus Parvarchaeota archaeon]|nr:type III-A CRISPR-associated RAMP protein Csm4 [Candidatus Jingweiarchaeum tengchongense]MCW1305502.1 type III-A CRISPR-associated RAMP protein Csm4 [Candidatus Jingweiarchaeum tengchongense]
MKIVKLYPKINSKFHFGYLGLDIDDIIFHSDSLFSTILINYIRKYGDETVKEFVKNFPNITSLFYGIKQGNSTVLFIPNIIGLTLPKELIDKDRKISKKIKFISIGYLKNIKSNNVRVNKSKNLIYLKDEGDEINLFYRDTEEKVCIDRKTLTVRKKKLNEGDKGSLYDVSYVRPLDNTFFYFLIDSDAISNELEESIKLIELFGMGGEASVGSGVIKEIEIDDFNEFDDMKGGNKFTNLSIVFPKSEEFDSIEKYKLIERKGWIYLDTKRKSNILGIMEGSIFNRKINGECKEDRGGGTINKIIYRYGKAFLIPVNEK